MRRKRRKNKQIKFIMITSLSLLFILTVGYAAFSTNLNISAKGNIAKMTPTKIKEKLCNTTSGDGFYKDIYEEGRCVYRGTNPNNYITFNNELWRIVAIENDGTLKIIKTNSISNLAWDTTDSDDWAKPAELNTYLNNNYYNTLPETAKAQIQSYNWGIGSIKYDNTDFANQLDSEKKKIWNGNIALISINDFISANSNIEQCGNAQNQYNNRETCKSTNYILTIVSTTTHNYAWLLSPYAYGTDYIWYVNGDDGCADGAHAYGVREIIPALYLQPNITLNGQGTKENPYKIIN